MEREAFLARVAEIMSVSPAEFVRDGGPLPPELDSVIVLDIMALVDEAFGVTLSPEELGRAGSAAAIFETVHAARG
jgi:hypothetical protein